MGLGEKQAAKLMELAQQNCDEPVVTAAIVLRKGETASRNIGGFAPAVSINRWMESMERAPTFPTNTLVVVTGNKMCLFEAKGGFNWKVKKPIGEYVHGSFQAEDAGTGKITRFLNLTFIDGTVAELEVQVLGVQKFQSAIVDELVTRSGQPLARA